MHAFHNRFSGRGSAGMNFVRPRYLAVAFFAFFGAVAYFAWIYARGTNSPWFTPDVSRTVYQTTMVGGVLVLVGLFITGSILSRFTRPVASRGFSPGPLSGGATRKTRSGFPVPEALPRTSPRLVPEWAP